MHFHIEGNKAETEGNACKEPLCTSWHLWFITKQANHKSLHINYLTLVSQKFMWTLIDLTHVLR